jgi:hypothetical protein
VFFNLGFGSFGGLHLGSPRPLRAPLSSARKKWTVSKPRELGSHGPKKDRTAVAAEDGEKKKTVNINVVLGSLVPNRKAKGGRAAIKHTWPVNTWRGQHAIRDSLSWPELYSGRGSCLYFHYQFPSLLAVIILVTAIYNDLPACHVVGNGPTANDFQGQNCNTRQRQGWMTHRSRGWSARPERVHKLRFNAIHVQHVE